MIQHMSYHNMFGINVYYYDSDDIIIQYLKKSILYGQHNFHLLNNFILHKSTIIDCGCHIGTFTIPAAMCGYDVIAIDGAKRNIECIHKTSQQFNDKIVCDYHILSNRIGKCSFSHTYGPFGHFIEDDNGTYNTNTLDNLYVDVDHVCGIKLDVEGSEDMVLLGGANIIQKYKPPILIEINGHCLRLQHKKPKHIFDVLDDLGYNIYLIQSLPVVPQTVIQINKHKRFPFCVIDLVCLHRDNMIYYNDMINAAHIKELTDIEIRDLIDKNFQLSNNDCQQYFYTIMDK